MAGNITLGLGDATLPQPKTKYTYDDFTKDVESAGLTGSFSDADLELAKNNPEAGKKLMGYKIDYNNATTDEGRAVANESANAVRKQEGGYSGGIDGLGTEYKATDSTEDVGEQQTAEDIYKERRSELMDRDEFSYDIENDSKWANYKSQYTDAMEAAGSDTLARIASASGGRISTAAARAAAQTEAEYMSDMADKAVELEEDAYSRWLKEQELKQQDLENLRDVYAEDYDREWSEKEYEDERADAVWEQNYNQALLDEEISQHDDEMAHEKALLDEEISQHDDEMAHNQAVLDEEISQHDDEMAHNKALLDEDARQHDDEVKYNLAETRAELGDYDKLNEYTDEIFGSEEDKDDAAYKELITELLAKGYSIEDIKALAGL